MIIEEPYSNFEVEPVVEQLFKTIRKLISHPIVQNRKFLGIGVSVPGIVDIQNGVISDSFKFHLHDYPIRDYLSSIFEKVVYVEHDASAAAVAEQYYGAGRGENNFIYMMVSEGIGSGVMLDGHIDRGQYGC